MTLYTDIDRLEVYLKDLSPADGPVIDEYIRAARSFLNMDLLGIPFAGLWGMVKLLPKMPALASLARPWSQNPRTKDTVPVAGDPITDDGRSRAMAKIRQLPRRQRYRKALLYVSLLLFPATLYYFSPMLILQGASEGVVNGSWIVFGLMFLVALFVGRLWCGWACPAGALQEFGQAINEKPTPGGKFNWIKWAIWIPWIGLIAGLAIGAGGYHTVNPLYQLETGVTMALPLDGSGPPWFMIYYIVIALFLGLAVIFGRRAGCHTLCWMAPFMILGRWVRNRARWPSLRLRPQPEQCSHCQTCTRNCPMSLNVEGMVQRGDMENGECILCGNCVDGCPRDVIRYSFSGG